MKIKTLAILLIAAMLAPGCSKNEKDQGQAEQTNSIDTSTVGKDTTSVDTRAGIEESDEQKLTTPGRDTIKSDEPK